MTGQIGSGLTAESSLSTLYLTETKDLNAKTETTQMKGYASFYDYSGGLNSTNINSPAGSADITINIDRETGETTGSIVYNSSLSLQFAGDLVNHTSYYTTDDNFGVMASSGLFGTSDYTQSSGFLVSRPDSYDSLNNVANENSDNYSSWGYWTSGFSGGSDVQHQVEGRSTWVAGELTNAIDLNDLASKAGTPTPTYKGNIIGAVNVGGSIEDILLNSTNQVQLNFNLSSGIVNGTFTFNSANSSWNEAITSGAATANDFIFNTTHGSGKGTYFGPNVDSVGGGFDASKTVDSVQQSAEGVFKAIKQ